MDESKAQSLRPTKLDLAAPLLTTRRSHAVINSEDNKDRRSTLICNNATSKDMVPFSWERIPGEPKDKDGTNWNYDVTPLPPPKPPPGRAQPPLPEANKWTDKAYGDDDDDDDDDNEDEHNGDRRKEEQFLDIIDFFSLADEESTYEEDDEEVYNRVTKEKRNSNTLLEYEEYPSPSFIIQRFLPDAQALAEASVMKKKGHHHRPISSPMNSSSRAVSVRRSYEAPKGCGLVSLFGWRILRPKPCSVKSPVRDDAMVGHNQKHN